MRIGIVTDIHEHYRNLRVALDGLATLNCDKIVCIGDVFETGENLDATVAMLIEAGVVSVWGNHDFGLCVGPARPSEEAYRPETLAYMRSFQPKVHIEDLTFSHIPPWLDPSLIDDLWSWEDEPWHLVARDRMREAIQPRLDPLPDRVYLMGHYHTWFVTNRHEAIDWDGTKPLTLAKSELSLIVVHAVVDGWFASIDTETMTLTPHRI